MIEHGLDYSRLDEPQVVLPSFPVLLCNTEGIQESLEYHSNICHKLGADMAQIVGVAEVAVKDVIKNREAFQEAIDRELMHMRQKRFVREGDEKAASRHFVPARLLKPVVHR